MHGLTGSRLPGDIAATMTDRPHNVASEFARAVLASGLRRHRDSLSKSYDTPFDEALKELGLERFNRRTPFWNWRRGISDPRPWAARLIANQLRANAQRQVELAARVEQRIGPGSPGKQGAEHWRRYHAMKRAEKEKGAEAPSTVNREP